MKKLVSNLVIIAFTFALLTQPLTISASARTSPKSLQSRIFPLHLMNGMNESVSFKITWTGSCYESSPGLNAVLGPIAPGGKATISIARVQGHGCNGKNAAFEIKPTNPRFRNEGQSFEYSNDGWIWLRNIPNTFKGMLGPKNSRDESFTWTMRDNSVDSAIFLGRNPIATDAGTWGSTAKMSELTFLKGGVSWPNFYDDCVGYELFHIQHVIRLKNQNGRAYFMVTQSRAHNGYISMLETDPEVLDPVTDVIVSKGGPVGKYIWQDVYTGPKNGTINPVGNWNHPGKMDLLGDVLIVAAQNWGESAPCFYGKGVTEDKVLFYDVSNPKQPQYWGAITASQLRVKEIATVGLVRAPNGDYLLTAGGDGTYTTLWAASISPDFADWSRSPGDSFAGQHGMMFSSYQNSTGGVVPGGTERLMYFDSEKSSTLNFTEYGYDAAMRTLKSRGMKRYPYNLPGAKRDWDSDSLYVSENGSTIIYSFKSQRGDNGVMYQLSDSFISPTGPTKGVGTLNVGAILRINEYVVSPGKKAFAVMQDDGNLVVYRGSGPGDNQGLVWGSAQVGGYALSRGSYYATLQDDGNLVIYRGSGPGDNQGFVWGSVQDGGYESSEGKYYAVMQDDGNLVIYHGSGPGDNQGFLWGSVQSMDRIK